jgi:hypothetical protein
MVADDESFGTEARSDSLLALEVRVAALEHEREGDPLRRRAKAVAAVTTFAIALAGFTFGAINFFGQQRITVAVTPVYRNFDYPHALQLGIVNTSARSVSITSGEVLVDGVVVGVLERILPFALKENEFRNLAEIEEAAQDLPYTIEAGRSLAGTALYDASLPSDPELRATFNDVLTGDVQPPEERVELRLDFEPGGSRTAPVRYPSSGRLLRVRDAGHLPGWNSYIDLDDGGRATFNVGGPPGIPSLVTLRLWREGSGKPFFSAAGPLPQGDAYFILPALARGAYAWSLSAGPEVVAAGRLTIPCEGAYNGRIVNSHTDC